MKGHWSEADRQYWVSLTGTELYELLLVLTDADLSAWPDRLIQHVNAYRDKLKRLERTKESFE